ncbi:hypothetical protein THMIRHAM_16760 [Thiomicrorhabdus immobilis]|uniref:RDD domain-containing protein n=1 Tax=Thiomicrorhabdus immobilis TaxID=2791037 RepID=A0ABN6CY23_9GAMM|nr:RDD family protein [Thiomicrorhabdus immobilis]BCN93891.1 hypothetical protein THMIRHAM_16760 [Thiomicrorhabdus immobilis]
MQDNQIANETANENTIQTAIQTKPVTYGGFWKRVAAYIIDWLILMLLSFVLMIIMGVFLAFKGLDPEDETAMLGVSLMGNLITLMLTWFYYAGMESSSKQGTFGKSLLGMKVTDLNGGRISFLRASARYFSKILSALLLFIGFIMVAFTEKKQGLHDMIAATLVVNK